MRHICGIDGWEEWAIFPLSFLIELINCNGKIDFNSNRAEFFIILLLTINNYHFSLSTLHSTNEITSFRIKSNGFQFKFHKNMNCWFQWKLYLRMNDFIRTLFDITSSLTHILYIQILIASIIVIIIVIILTCGTVLAKS